VNRFRGIFVGFHRPSGNPRVTSLETRKSRGRVTPEVTSQLGRTHDFRRSWGLDPRRRPSRQWGSRPSRWQVGGFGLGCRLQSPAVPFRPPSFHLVHCVRRRSRAVYYRPRLQEHHLSSLRITWVGPAALTKPHHPTDQWSARASVPIASPSSSSATWTASAISQGSGTLTGEPSRETPSVCS
jgi:hypothetical protein